MAPPPLEIKKSLKMGYSLGIEFISAIFMGGMIGYFIDKYFQTNPWGMILFLVFGVLAGSLNIYRVFESYQQPNENKK